MKTKDDIFLEQAYSKILKEELNPQDFPNTRDDINTFDKNEIEIEFEGNPFWVKFDFDGAVQRIITNLGSSQNPDHIVEITPENAPKIYEQISEIAKEKRREEISGY